MPNAQHHIPRSLNDQYTTTQSPIQTIYDGKQNIDSQYDDEHGQIIEDMDSGDDLKSLCDSEDEIQQPQATTQNKKLGFESRGVKQVVQRKGFTSF